MAAQEPDTSWVGSIRDVEAARDTEVLRCHTEAWCSVSRDALKNTYVSTEPRYHFVLFWPHIQAARLTLTISGLFRTVRCDYVLSFRVWLTFRNPKLPKPVISLLLRQVRELAGDGIRHSPELLSLAHRRICQDDPSLPGH